MLKKFLPKINNFYKLCKFNSNGPYKTIFKDITNDHNPYEEDIVRMSVQYPKTQLKDKPLIEFNQGIISDKLDNFILHNQSLMAVGCTQDIHSIIKLLKKYNIYLLAEQVDSIQIYNGKTNIISIYKSPEIENLIKEKSDKLDHSIYVEINHITHKLFQHKVLEKRSVLANLFITFILSTCFSVWLYIIYNTILILRKNN